MKCDDINQINDAQCHKYFKIIYSNDLHNSNKTFYLNFHNEVLQIKKTTANLQSGTGSISPTTHKIKHGNRKGLPRFKCTVLYFFYNGLWL